MTTCTCGHPSWHHQRVTFPTRRNPCTRCTHCGGDTRTLCCLNTTRCPCKTYEAAL